MEVGREPANMFIPQTHLLGREAEVDFGEVVVRLRGEPVTCTSFSLRLSYSGKAVHRISASAGQEAFFEGHAHGQHVAEGAVPERPVAHVDSCGRAGRSAGHVGCRLGNVIGWVCGFP